jgi:glycosyltransferase involved in cell wall biosynthesis
VIVFVVECPSPYHTPVLNRLQRELVDDVCVFYLYGGDTHGWGEVAVEHRHVFLGRAGGWTALARALLSPRLRAVCVYGYRGAARVTAALMARVRGRPLTLRGAANARDELARSRLRRLVKRTYLRAILGQPEVWTGGSANTAYWNLLDLRRQHLIPYALARLPAGESAAADLRARLDLDGRFVFTFVGRLEPIKGIAEILDAFDRVRTSTPDGSTALVVVGRGSLVSLVRGYADAHDDVRYLGAVPHGLLGAVYAAADVCLVPSHREPWGWVVNEALGHGTRVIASAEVAAADELCTDEHGRRCPAGDPEALAASMLAEFGHGRRRAPRIAPIDTARMIADRLAHLCRSPKVRAPNHAVTPTYPPKRH